MDQPPPQPKTLETEVRKSKREKKKDRVKFSLTFDNKDVEILFR